MSVASFAEESCWFGDARRPGERRVVFRLLTTSDWEGDPLDLEIRASYELWYDPEDSLMISTLRDAHPSVTWDHLVYWKKIDHSGISVIRPLTDEEVAVIRLRGHGETYPVDPDWTNVVSLVTNRRHEIEGGQG